MATASTPTKAPRKIWTVADLYRRFGPIAFERIRQNPPPGCGTVDDVIRLNDHDDPAGSLHRSCPRRRPSTAW